MFKLFRFGRKTSKENDGTKKLTKEKADGSDNSSSGDGPSNSTALTLSTSSKTNTSGKKKTKSSSKRKDKTRGPTPNEQVWINYVAMKNRHAPPEEILAECFASHDTKIKFEDAPSLTAAQFVQEIAKCYRSFEDVHWEHESCKGNPNPNKKNEVIVENFVVTGTHTGAPFGFAHFPPISADPENPKHVVLCPDRVFVTINKDGKIADMMVYSMGNLTGPPGFYLGIGGSIDGAPPPLLFPANDAVVTGGE